MMCFVLSIYIYISFQNSVQNAARTILTVEVNVKYHTISGVLHSMYFVYRCVTGTIASIYENYLFPRYATGITSSVYEYDLFTIIWEIT